MEMKRVYQYIYPDQGGNHFYSVVVWEGVLETHDNPSWTVPVRILEARFVIRGTIKYHLIQSATTDMNSNWNHIMSYALELTDTWGRLFEIHSQIKDVL